MVDTLKMYKMKSIIDSNLNIPYSKCMYKMKNIHEPINHVHIVLPPSNLDISEKVNKFLKSSEILPEMIELEKRQQKILEQLEILKKQMEILRTELKITVKPDQISKKIKVPLNSNSISIKTDVEHVPYFLLIVRKLWNNRIHLVFNVHTHSSVSSLPENVQSFSENLLTTNNTNNNKTLPQLHITLIWKKVKFGTELTVSSLRPQIIGDVNILRYFARIDPESFYLYEVNNFMESLIIDKILDMCYRLEQSKTKTERQQLLRMLNGLLGKSEWLLGNNLNMSLADIAAFNIINQLQLMKDLTINMSKWFQRCLTFINENK